MGMYTELIIGCRLKQDTPAEVVSVLLELIEGEPVTRATDLGFCCSLFKGSSFAYFAVREPRANMYTDDEGFIVIDSRAHFKNHDDLIERFLSWLKPHVYDGSGSR